MRRDREFWREYLQERTGTYEYRTRRYGIVADELEKLGLEHGDLIVDVGAGMCEFARYLYSARGWSGQYVPVDGSIDGTDLNEWYPSLESLEPDFYVAIEVLEHLKDPITLLREMQGDASKGVVITTPNTDFLGEDQVRGMDRTHVRPLWRAELIEGGGNVVLANCFGQGGSTGHDTIVASYRGLAEGRKAA